MKEITLLLLGISILIILGMILKKLKPRKIRIVKVKLVYYDKSKFTHDFRDTYYLDYKKLFVWKRLEKISDLNESFENAYYPFSTLEEARKMKSLILELNKKEIVE